MWMANLVITRVAMVPHVSYIEVHGVFLTIRGCNFHRILNLSVVFRGLLIIAANMFLEIDSK